MNQTEVKIPKHKLRQLGIFLVSLLFVYIGYRMINSEFRSSRMSPGTATVFGYLGIAFFGLIGLLVFFNMLTLKPALILNKNGIINNSHLGGGYLIRWGNIKTVKIISIDKQRMIKITLRNDEEIYQQVNFLARKMMKVNGRFMGTPTFIPSVMIKMNLDDVLLIIKEHKKNNSKRRTFYKRAKAPSENEFES